MEKIVLNVEGMKCGGCESSVVSSLEKLSGVESALADRGRKQVEIEYDAGSVSVADLVETVAAGGYRVTPPG